MPAVLIWVAAFFMCVIPARAQEDLFALLERGHVEDWLVCGPFASDVEGGIVTAALQGRSPLGSREYMESVGGIARLRPQHRQLVESADGSRAVWQRARAESPGLDLAPFFPNADEGVAYAAFYVDAPRQQSVFFDLHSSLSGRLWINGRPFRDISVATPPAGGRERFVATFPAGINLVTAQFPGAQWEPMARRLDMHPRDFQEAMLRERPALNGESGFAFSLTLKPALAVGTLFCIPELAPANTFSGTTAEPRQNMRLTLINPDIAFAEPAVITLTGADAMALDRLETPPLPPYTTHEHIVSVPVRAFRMADPLPVTVEISANGEQVVFEASVAAAPYTANAAVYYSTGPKPTPVTNPRVRPATDVPAFARYLLLADGQPAFGFDYGPVSEWLPAMIARPDLGATMGNSVATGASATRPAFDYPDHRIVGGEMLWRDLAYGILSADARLSAAPGAALLWRAPGIAPQYPQLLSRFDVAGLVSNREETHLYPFFEHLALDGSSRLHRRLSEGVAPDSEQTLRHAANESRREMSALGFARDILVRDTVATAPDEILGSVAQLTGMFPPILLTGAGPNRLFADAQTAAPETRAAIPLAATYMNRGELGAVVAQGDLKQAYGELESRLSLAERFATCAALLGARYPEAALDRAWRLLLFAGAPWRLGLAADEDAYLDTLAACREAAVLSRATLENSLDYIARQANTLGAAPFVPREVSVTAVVVFNPIPYRRVAPVMTTLDMGRAQGLAVVDAMDEPVPFTALNIERSEDGFIRRARVQFPAEVPGLGYATYYVKSTGPPTRLVTRSSTVMANDTMEVRINPETGDIARITDLVSGEVYDSGPMNRFMALNQDATRTDGGRFLWTSGALTDGLGRPVSITLEEGEWMRRMRIENRYGGGIVRRTLTLYDGIPYIECETAFVGARPSENTVAGVLFSLDGSGRAGFWGERFGAAAGVPNSGRHDMRIRNRDNRSMTGAQPALRWFSAATSDYIDVQQRGQIPLRPAVIIHGEDVRLKRAAKTLARALVRRGIPASLRPDTVEPPGNRHRDDTMPHRLELDDTGAMRIMLGGPRLNRQTDRLLESLPREEQAALAARIEQGVLLLLDDVDAPLSSNAAPALLIAGEDAAHTERLVEAAAENLASGVLPLPDNAWFASAPLHPPLPGLALLFPGTRLCALEPDGQMFMALTCDAGPALTFPGDSVFRYAIAPFDGDWRDADIPGLAAAFCEPLVASTLTPQRGSQPGRMSFLEFSEPGFVVTAVKAAGLPLAAFSGKDQHPGDGMLVRGFESRGRHWRGDARLFQPLLSAASANAREMTHLSLAHRGDTITLHAPPFSIESLWLLTGAGFRAGAPESLTPGESSLGPSFSRYWTCGDGVADTGGVPLTVSLAGDISAESPEVDVYVVNHTTDTDIEGALFLDVGGRFSVEDRAHYYHLRPGETYSRAVPLALRAEPRGRDAIKAHTRYRDLHVVDALHADAPVSMRVERTLAQIRVTLENSSGIEVTGVARVLCSPRLWSELGHPDTPAVVPAAATVTLPPLSTQTLFFALSEPDTEDWVAVRFSGHGMTLTRMPGQ